MRWVAAGDRAGSQDSIAVEVLWPPAPGGAAVGEVAWAGRAMMRRSCCASRSGAGAFSSRRTSVRDVEGRLLEGEAVASGGGPQGRSPRQSPELERALPGGRVPAHRGRERTVRRRARASERARPRAPARGGGRARLDRAGRCDRDLERDRGTRRGCEHGGDRDAIRGGGRRAAADAVLGRRATLRTGSPAREREGAGRALSRDEGEAGVESRVELGGARARGALAAGPDRAGGCGRRSRRAGRRVEGRRPPPGGPPLPTIR